MYIEIDKFLKKQVGSNIVQVSGRVPEKLAKALKQKGAELNVDASTLVRTALAIFVMPELLEQLVDDEAMNCISQEGGERIQHHFGEKYEKYKDIIEFAQFANEKTKELSEQFLQAEVDYMNKVSKKKTERKSKTAN